MVEKRNIFEQELDKDVKVRTINNVYYMIEHLILSERKTARSDWMPSRTISFSYGPASFGGESFELNWRHTNQIQVSFTKYLQ